jgi:GT2 family glycosyltransferase
MPANNWLEGFRSADTQLGKNIVCGSVDFDEPSNLSQFMEYVIWKLPENSRMPRGPHLFIVTANMMIRKEDFLITGGFGDSDSANDAEMDAARQRAGLEIYFEPTARVFHIHPRGWKYHIAKLYRVGQEEFELMQSLKGYRVGRWMVRLFPIVFFVRWLRITWFLLRLRPRWIGRYLSIQPMLWAGLLAHQAGLWRGLFKTISRH